LEINNITLKNDSLFKITTRAQLILNKYKDGELADYKIKKPSGEIVETKVVVKKLIQFDSLASEISALIFLLIGFIVYSAKPDGLSHKLFFALGITSVLSAANVLVPFDYVFVQFIQEHPISAAFIVTILIPNKVFGPIILLYFVWTFPNPFRFAEKKSVKLTLLLVSLLLSLIGIALAISLYFTRFESIVWFTIYQVAVGILLIAVYGVSWVSLIIQYKRETNRKLKKPLLIFVLAFTFAILLLLYVGTIAPAISDTVFNSPEYYMPIILYVFVPVAFAYAIFKYHLLDVSIVVRNTIIYGAAMATIAGIYFVVIYLLGQGIGNLFGKESQGFVAGILFLIFAFVFQSTKDRFQDFLTRKFYPEQFAYQRVLIQFNNDVATVVGSEKILDITAATFVEALKINKFGILIKDYKKDVLSLARGVGFSNSDCIIEKSNLISVVNEKLIYTQYQVIEQQDFETVFPGKSERLIAEGVYSVIPMIIKSKVVGALLFGLKYSGSKFGGKDIELLNAAANQIAVALENARLYQLESEKIKIERELDLARQIQQSLLPKAIPQINGLDISGQMIPAMQVGGDYFDLIQISDTKLFVAVGDVSGKGLSASFYMTKVQTMIQLASNNSLSPKEILVEVNKKMYETMERNWFVTLTLALFDIENRTVRFCRAGHLPLITANNGKVEAIRSEGIGLGLEKGDVFERTLKEEEIKIKSKQIFAFFSDGITEAMNEKNELFGDAKLNALIIGSSEYPSGRLMQNVWEAVKNFRGSTPPNDDMTMVIVKVI
ncbi:MAG: SpoIIE family protein phosphatase, partial [Ignavibacteriaceae bacterium]|nr:SpoIIE family protein phosphatase [Ignavibacteriaceae bacterium]